MHRKTVVIGLLGTQLDQRGGFGPGRWDSWRPSVAACQQPDLLVDRFELLHGSAFERLAELVAKDMRQTSPETEVRRHVLDLADPWDFEEVYASLYDFAESYPFDTDAEDYLVHISTGTHVLQICLFLLTESRHFPARLLQTGLKPRSTDPVGICSVIDLDLSRYDRIAERFQRKASAGASVLKAGIETKNQAFNAMIARLERVAAQASGPILLTGPTGAGKSRLARLVYDLRRERRVVQGDFVAVNCATLRGDAAMSALFGHRKGAFTGATGERAGLLRQADGGVLFLDEVGELGLDEQAMLLRAVEEGRFYALGADRESESAFQLICGTNRNLERQAALGLFREDLLSRIKLWTFRLPGLAERPEDIEPNLDYELEQASEKLGRRIRFNREARELFLKLAAGPDALWRGSFRDLSSLVLRLGVLADGGRVDAGLVRDEWARLVEGWRRLGGACGGMNRGTAGESGRLAEDRALLEAVLGREALEALDLFDQPQLALVLRTCRQAKSLSEAGRTLFASSRLAKARVNDADRLRKYLARFDLAFDGVKAILESVSP
ncbi:MAG: RNA repair transcriptional activator RtcR [Desulfovibrio sp.]|nr:RNA repair transcriptional activator RtcR [Desulfovibrio sp.]